MPPSPPASTDQLLADAIARIEKLENTAILVTSLRNRTDTLENGNSAITLQLRAIADRLDKLERDALAQPTPTDPATLTRLVGELTDRIDDVESILDRLSATDPAVTSSSPPASTMRSLKEKRQQGKDKIK